jgi:hypothetical protein
MATLPAVQNQPTIARLEPAAPKLLLTPICMMLNALMYGLLRTKVVVLPALIPVGMTKFTHPLNLNCDRGLGPIVLKRVEVLYAGMAFTLVFPVGSAKKMGVPTTN